MVYIDRELLAAFSVKEHPGTYALLIGSGVSRAADIFTGWQIVVDMIEKLAIVEGDQTNDDPEQWYLDKYGSEPDYSMLLDTLTRTSSDRQQLLRQYFEPDELEREAGMKRPTVAHRAIAWLMAEGFVRVVITTNFDRLIEMALRDVGVEPVVISTPEQAQGALPFVHLPHVVFKVHGDYLDPSILNTQQELERYAPPVRRPLHQVIDQFGLIVCGWSAEWDVAMRKVMHRSAARRFAMYWVDSAELREHGRELAEFRQADYIQRDAEQFFGVLRDNVEALARMPSADLLSPLAAVATLKRHLSPHEDIVRFTDHVNTATRQTVLATEKADHLLANELDPAAADFVARLRSYEAACSALIAMAAVGGFWSQSNHLQCWQRSLQQLYRSRTGRLTTPESLLQNYSAYLTFYAFGLGAIEAGKIEHFGQMCDLMVAPWAPRVSESTFLVASSSDMRRIDWHGLLRQAVNPITARSDHVYGVLQEAFRQLTPDDEHYRYTFDKLEVLMGLGLAYQHPDWSPPSLLETFISRWANSHHPLLGSFLNRMANFQRVVDEIEESLGTYRDGSPYVMSGVFGSDYEQCRHELREYARFVRDFARRDSQV